MLNQWAAGAGKRAFCLCLALALMLLGCQNAAVAQETTPAQRRILIIGNSHSVDAFHLLHLAYTDQNDDSIILGVLYYGGCSIDQHNEFARNDQAEYRYYYTDTNGDWFTRHKQTMKDALKDQPWDTIVLQAAKTDLDATLNLDGRRELEAYVNRYVKTPHQFLWHTSWPSPNDERFFAPDWINPAPEGYKENLMNLYGFNPINQYRALTEMATTYIFPDPTYAKKICTGTAIMYAYQVRRHSQMDLWRDYTHLSDFGRLVAAYSMLAQLTGKPVRNIHLQTVPVKLRYYDYREQGDLALTDTMKTTIKQAANYSLLNPFGIIQ